MKNAASAAFFMRAVFVKGAAQCTAGLCVV